MRLEISISDPIFAGAQRAAAAAGLSVDQFVQEAVKRQLRDEPDDDFAWFFTPTRIAEIREAAAEAQGGNNLSPEQVEAHFAAKRAAWHSSKG